MKVALLERLAGNQFMQFIVSIIDKCNLNCTYCYNEKLRTGIMLDLDKLYSFICYLKEQKQQPIEVDILGGEPTLHPDLYDFCKKISIHKNIDVEIYSNFLQDINYYKCFLELKNIRFDFSYHSIQSKRNISFIKKLIELIKLNKYKGKKINVTLMIENGQMFDDIKKIDQIFKKLNIYKLHNVDYRLIMDFNDSQNKLYYTQSQLEYFKQHYIASNPVKNFGVQFDNGTVCTYSIEEFDYESFCKFKNWKCNAGLESMYCNFNGDLYHCQHECIEHIKPFSNIYNKQQYLIPTTFQICRCNNCRCDSEVTKWN